jgi:hypothetical protein
MDWLAIAIEEYKTLREECLMSIKMQYSILAFGAAIIGVVISTGFNVWDKSPLPEILFLLLVPASAYLVIIIWLGEVSRMFRAGRLISTIEIKINKQFPDIDNPLTWETWLITKQDTDNIPQKFFRIRDIAIFLFFIVVSILSIYIGNIKLAKGILYPQLLIIDIVEVIVMFFVIILSLKVSHQIGHNQQKLNS